jgi:hypothetical protein
MKYLYYLLYKLKIKYFKIFDQVYFSFYGFLFINVSLQYTISSMVLID